MYLEHFKLNEPPFSLTPNTNFYCDLPTHQETLNALLSGLQQGDGFIKIIGKMGTGKTLLCLLLLHKLSDDFVTVYIPNSDPNGHGLHELLAHDLGLSVEKNLPQDLSSDMITQRLLELHKAGKKTVLIIDESHALSDDCLETVQLLTSLETEGKKVLQVVLCGQPELDKRLKKHALRQLKQRITLSCRLKLLNKNELNLYLCHRLAKAGYTCGMIFSASAKKRLFRASGGLPRLLNVLCHKALLVSYGRGINQVDTKSMRRAIADTESILRTRHLNCANAILVLTTTVCIALIMVVYRKAGLF